LFKRYQVFYFHSLIAKIIKMNSRINWCTLLLILCSGTSLFSQPEVRDTTKVIKLDAVILTAGRIPVTLMQNTGSTSIVGSGVLKTLPRSVAVDEALRLVPGVRIDNQANGSRVHMSIRGQGILSERGLRGIKVIIDGVPANDPSGFASDLYDIDWPSVSKIEVLRGPATSLYGCSSNAGILNITTAEGSDKPAGGLLYGSMGSNGFAREYVQVDGKKDKINYRLSASGFHGDGYRLHTAFRGNNISEKITWKPSERITLMQLFILTRFFNQNAEGLNLSQLDNPKQANPDAIPCNEYQKTQRLTNGLKAAIKITDNQDISCIAFLRMTNYKEPGSSAVQYRHFFTPGASLQYNINSGQKAIRNHFSAGADIQYQQIEEYKVPNIKDTARTEKKGEMDEKVFEGTALLANQTIDQSALGIFVVDRLELGERFNAILSVRYDNMKNKLIDKMNGVIDLSGDANYHKTTARLGLSYRISSMVYLYGNVGQGFLPPATEELASNPVSFGGFNSTLMPAFSLGEEIGVRGNIKQNLFYDLTGFMMKTENDFYRYRILPERPLETFYGNAGKTQRMGFEAFVHWIPIRKLDIQIAYTYSNFKYEETSSDSMYTNGIMLPAIVKGNVLPNSPMHQLYGEVGYTIGDHFSIGLSTEYQSKWYIYTNIRDTQDGFNLYHARVSYEFHIGKMKAEISIYAKNLTNKSYMAFTEPDPDGNSYQPAAGREFFGSLRVQL
jgi:iron complex outermembrane receptor protein